MNKRLRERDIWYEKDIGGSGDMSYSTRNVTNISVKTEDEHKARDIRRDMQAK
ncbi:hypothetical protein [Salibacterium salarium]|uniref:hypothetical protein n=1 Tax=Salibacterium salarium TaxID=284579 RepID=UPI0027D80B57|nr:hypothetical protein [Salibacterium salarium]